MPPHTTQSAAEQLGIQYSVLSLSSWPDFQHIPLDNAADFARVCALLAKRPTAALLIGVILGLSKDRVEQAIAHLHEHGHLNQKPGRHSSPSQLPSAEIVPVEEGQGIKRLWGFLRRMSTSNYAL